MIAGAHSSVIGQTTNLYVSTPWQADLGNQSCVMKALQFKEFDTAYE